MNREMAMKGYVVVVVAALLALAVESILVDIASLNRSNFPASFMFGIVSSA